MISSLIIRNFIIVEELKLNFTDGLTVITGETGVGKSVIIGAINLILGGQLTTDVHYDKHKSVYLEITFSNIKKQNPIFEEFGLESGDDVVVSKTIDKNRVSKCYLNRTKIKNSQAKMVKQMLIDYHSQSGHLQLFDKGFQLELLDTFAHLQEKRQRFSANLTSLKKTEKELKIASSEFEQKKQSHSLYSFQKNELDGANLVADEEQELFKELNILSYAKQISDLLNELVFATTESDEALYSQINSLLLRAQEYSENSKQIAEIASNLRDALFSLNEASLGARGALEQISQNPQRVAEIETRLDILSKLKQKYNMDIGQLIELCQKLETLIDGIEISEKSILKLEDLVKKKRAGLLKLGKSLSSQRKLAAKDLQQRVNLVIVDLALANAEFKIEFSKKQKEFQDFFSTGLDAINFLFSANLNQKAKPIKNSISGGELSRLVLALKSILASRSSNRSFIFDEIDSGIGGATANFVGKYIQKIAKIHQTFVITHLPQIASFAKTHYFIDKKVVDTRSRVSVARLGFEQKKSEIARMLSGSSTKAAVEHAKEILGKPNINNS